MTVRKHMTRHSGENHAMRKPTLRVIIFAIVAGIAATMIPGSVNAAGLYNMALANLKVKDAAGNVTANPTDLNAWLTNVDTGASVKLTKLNKDVNQWSALSQPDGRYRLSVTSAGKYPTVWWPGSYTVQGAGVLVLRQGAGANCAGALTTTGCYSVTWDWTVQAARSISGRISERRGGAAAGAPVTATRDGDPSAVYSATTDAGGYYAMSLPPGGYTFSVPNGNTTDTTWVNVTAQGQNISFTRTAPPLPPGAVYATPSSKRLSVTWSTPTDNGGKDITGYRAVAQPGGQSCTSDQNGCVIDGIRNNIGYSVTVTASNAVGESGPSAASPVVVPLDPAPSAPRDVRAVAASRQAIVSWTQPAAESDAITGYRVVSSPGGFSCTTKDLSCTVGGLTNGTAYTFRVSASSTGGESPASEPSAPVTPAAAPAAPREVTATAGVQSLIASWNAPADNGGAAITSYTATANPGGRQCTTTADARTCTISNLTRRPYTVTVTAANRVGSSPASAPSAEVTPLDTVPAAPLGISSVAGDRQATVSWAAPGNGAEAITGYRVTSSPGAFTCTTKDLSCTVSGLTNGISYTFRVTASSTGGESAASEPSAPVTPAGPPSIVRSVQAEPGDRSLLVSWAAPLDDGGSPVTGYTATAWPGGLVCTAPRDALQCAIGGLSNGTTYTVTVTATNRVGTSERSPGSGRVVPNSALPAQNKGPSVSLRKVKTAKGKTTVRWAAVGMPQVRVSWQRLTRGMRHSQVTAATGRLILKGKKGERFRVTVDGSSTAGKKTSVSKVFRITK